MLINHRQSSTAFVCFLSEENNLAFGVHRPMLPSSIKIVRKLVELTEQYLLLFSAVTASIPGNVTKKVKLSRFQYYTREIIKKKKTRGWVPETNSYPGKRSPSKTSTGQAFGLHRVRCETKQNKIYRQLRHAH